MKPEFWPTGIIINHFFEPTSTPLSHEIPGSPQSQTERKSINFKLVTINPRSMCNKFIDVKEFINSENCGIMAIAETWLVREMDTKIFNIQDFSFFHEDRTERGGGVGLYVRSSFKPKKIEIPEFQNGIDTIWVQMKVNKLSIAVEGLYRPPNVSYRIYRIVFMIFYLKFCKAVTCASALVILIFYVKQLQTMIT